MLEQVRVFVNDKAVDVPVGTTVAAAIARAGVERFRRSVSGELRGPLCGMGVCFECRVTIDGTAQRRSCQALCQDGMEVRTDAC
jgi:D-hydroxyproline dehydrogenase subunit gamma